MKQLHFNLFHCCLVLFVAECARGLFIPSLWSTVQYVRHNHISQNDDKHDRAFLGYCIGIFSAGRMAGSLAMGAWSDKRKDDGLPILVCVLISLTSACTYLLGCYFRSYWVLLTAMCGLGFGGGSLAVCRSHVSRITVESSRLLHMTLTTVAQYVGLAVMPMVALGVNHLVGNTSYGDDHGINETPSTPHHTWWNHHTAPAWLLVLLNLFSCVTHFTIFVASYESQEHIDARKAEEEAEARLAHHRHEANLNGVVRHDVHADDPNVHTAPTPTTKIIMDENAIDEALATQPPTVTTVVVNVDQQEHDEHEQLLNGRSDSSSGLTQKHPSQTESTPDTRPIIRSSSTTSSPSSSSRSLWQRMHEGALYVGMCLCILPKHHRYNALSYTEDLYDREGEVTARNKARLLRIGCVLFIFMNFTVRGVLAVIETVGTPQLAVIRNLHTAFQEIEASSLFFGLLGLAGLLVFVVVVYLPDHIHEAATLTVGFAIVIIGSAVIVWGGNRPAAFYFGCVCIWSLGYPAIQNSVFSAFSRILGSKPQGSMMGLIQVFGSLGRITLPLVSSQSSVTFAFAVCVVLCVVSVVGLLFYINLGRIEQERLARQKRAKDGIVEKEINNKNERKCVRWGGKMEKEEK